MIYLLDTNICIDYLRTASDSPVAIRLAEHDPLDVILCSVVKAELIFGALRSRNPDGNLVKLQAFFAPFASVPFDDRAAQVSGQIRAMLAEQGHTDRTLRSTHRRDRTSA